MVRNNNQIADIVSGLRDADNIESLFDHYEQIMNSELILSKYEAKQVQRFIDKIYYPILAVNNKEVKKYFEKNFYFISVFKRLLNNLITSSKTYNYSKNREMVDNGIERKSNR